MKKLNFFEILILLSGIVIVIIFFNNIKVSDSKGIKVLYMPDKANHIFMSNELANNTPFKKGWACYFKLTFSDGTKCDSVVVVGGLVEPVIYFTKPKVVYDNFYKKYVDVPGCISIHYAKVFPQYCKWIIGVQDYKLIKITKARMI